MKKKARSWRNIHFFLLHADLVRDVTHTEGQMAALSVYFRVFFPPLFFLPPPFRLEQKSTGKRLWVPPPPPLLVFVFVFPLSFPLVGGVTWIWTALGWATTVSAMTDSAYWIETLTPSLPQPINDPEWEVLAQRPANGRPVVSLDSRYCAFGCQSFLVLKATAFSNFTFYCPALHCRKSFTTVHPYTTVKGLRNSWNRQSLGGEPSRWLVGRRGGGGIADDGFWLLAVLVLVR